jgi:farnesyl diphosphate synthase
VVLQSRLTQAAAQIESCLMGELAPLADEPVIHAMRYAVAGGKRLRGFLVLQSAALYAPAPGAIYAAAAIEAMHAYSLVHDDLPCMDDDDLRRGQPTVHIKWDQATAVLAGDALQTLAFDLLADPRCHADTAVRVDLLRSMAQAAGARGMVLGQALDIAAETSTTPLGLDDITALQAGKTGALIEWSACAGARLAGADTAPLQTYAQALGLAFQIADDILDIEGDEAATGKRVGKDHAAGKATFVSLLGLQGARARAQDLVNQAQDALAPFGDRADTLRAVAQFVVTRKS